MGYTVISSKPSPYARKVRINLMEQGIPFTLQTEVPWNRDTKTPQYNPLEKLPILIVSDETDSSKGLKVVYESKVILEYLNTSPSVPSSTKLLPSDPDERIQARQFEALADGIADAFVLNVFEDRRGDSKSKEWFERQQRKIESGLKALDEIVREEGSPDGFLVGNRLSVADLAAGSLLGFMSLRAPDHHWKKSYPALETYWRRLEERESFKHTAPETFEIVDKVV